MRQLPPSRASSGYTPNRLKPLAVAPVNDQGQRLTDIQAIQRLFANGENGGYWPADPAYLYEDSAGTIPATLNGVVGLWKEFTQNQTPTTISNLIPSGEDFSTWLTGVYGNHVRPTVTVNTDIAPDSTLTADTLTCTHASACTLGNPYPLIAASPNGVFTFSCYIKSADVTSAGLFIAYGTGTTYSASSSLSVAQTAISVTNSWGRYSFTGVLPNNVNITSVQACIGFGSSTVGKTMQVWGAQLVYGDTTITYGTTVNSTSKNALQTTTAKKPYLRRAPRSNTYFLDSNSLDLGLFTILGVAGQRVTIAKMTPGGVEIAEDRSVFGGINVALSYSYAGDLLIINRALTPAEKALVTRHFNRNKPFYGHLQNYIPQLRGYVSHTETVPGWSSLTSLSSFWRNGGALLNDFPLINTSNITNIDTAFYGCVGLTAFPEIDTTKVTSARYTWSYCGGLVSFPALDLSNATDFYETWGSNMSLTTMPLVKIAKATTFQRAWLSCVKLTTFPSGFFDNWIGVPANNCFTQTWSTCSSLSLQSVQNILVSIATSGRSAPTTGKNIDMNGAASVATVQADSATMAAVATLKSSGWIPVYNGTSL